jgi:UDP:flavonoid glycosyltransferase YjiC (YdhE family)
MNSVHESLYYDVPLVVVPQQTEQMLVAKRVADLGAGQSLKREQVTPTQLRAAAETILSNPVYATQAQKVGESLRAAGGYQRAADEIMQLILR